MRAVRVRPSTRRLLQLAWAAYLLRAQGYQNTVILTLVYFVIVGPTVLASRLFRIDMLHTSKASTTSFWTLRERRRSEMADLRRQF